MSQHIIVLEGLTKKYGALIAVNDLHLTINKGEIYGLLGPNGAGKSTTIRMMLGLTEPTAGIVRVCGIDSTVNPIDVKRRVGYLPDNVGFYDNRTGLENLLFIARLNRTTDAEAHARAKELLDRVGLADAMHKKAGAYSRGMRQRLGLADVLIKKPEVIILDEPTLGIDPSGVREFLQLIVQLSREEGLTVLLSSHHLYQVQQVCDRVGIFVGGKLLANGDIPTLSKQLFTGDSFVIEAGVRYPNPAHAETQRMQLEQTLRDTSGVSSVQVVGERFRIGCSEDMTALIARIIVQAKIDLTYLSKKEYGLDDIYQRYFEGGQTHEQVA
ncbi:hypothetical protein GCM10023231_41100 [Olivibacter ginsenosidimutans]|uniref:ABC transporter domain-containing protein n=1 Tax=Olivibacter ginsenosidimutans TaxID=1176537 RepID=A0ABP9CGY3_9SPHI